MDEPAVPVEEVVSEEDYVEEDDEGQEEGGDEGDQEGEEEDEEEGDGEIRRGARRRKLTVP